MNNPGHRSRNKCLAMILPLVVVLAGLPVRAAPAAPLSADQAGYASVDAGPSSNFNWKCVGPGRLTDWMFAYGAEYDIGWMPTFIIVHPRASTTGQMLQLGDNKWVTEERVEVPPPSRPSWVNVVGTSSGGGGVLRNHYAWAFWGDDQLTCTLNVDGALVSTYSFDGSHAVYVGPEAFGGGVFSQSGSSQTSVGRYFARDTSGGPLFAALQIWGRERTPLTNEYSPAPNGFLATDDPNVTSPVEPCNAHLYGGATYCQIGRPKVSHVVAGIVLGESNDGTGQELWMIDVPRLPTH